MSEYLKKLIDQAQQGLVDWDAGLTELVADQENAIKADSFDQLAWNMLLDGVPKLTEQEQRLINEIGPEMSKALEDLFNLLHQGDPMFTERAEMLPEFEINLIVLLDLAQTEEFKQLYEETRYDEYQTAFAMLTMEEFVKAAFEAVSDLREQMKAAGEQQKQAMDDLAKAVDEAMQGDGDAEGLEEAVAAAEAAEQAMKQARQNGREGAQEAVEQLRQGAQQAKDEIDAEKELAGGYGLDPGELQKMSYEERQALAKRLSQSRIADFAKLLGQFRQFGDAERRRKVKHAPAEVYDYELTNDLTRLTSTEMTALAIPELEDHFWLRWAQHALLTKKVRGTENMGQGPIIVVCDESSSMDQPLDAEGHTREAWSKAVSLALCDQAKRGKRDFIYIGFASVSQQHRIDFPGGVAPIAKVVEFTEHFFGGGTHYERPLTDAMNIIMQNVDSDRPRPDVVLITDAECDVQPEFIREWQRVKDRADVAVYGIQIGGSGYYSALAQLADKVIDINQFNATPKGVQELFRGI